SSNGQSKVQQGAHGTVAFEVSVDSLPSFIKEPTTNPRLEVRRGEDGVERLGGPVDGGVVLILHLRREDDLDRGAEAPVTGGPPLFADHAVEPEPEVRLVERVPFDVFDEEEGRGERTGEIEVERLEVVDDAGAEAAHGRVVRAGE